MSEIRRLTADDATAIIGCFQRVYGDTYANEMFHDATLLSDAIDRQKIMSVGAIETSGKIIAHMAMTVTGPGRTPELGNTVVDPDARGGGLAWKVGQSLTSWCRELGNAGFVHYPTTDHHIMQRQAVEQGVETGLMLGYIPATTNGKVNDRHTGLRQAATIVYQLVDDVPPLLAQYLSNYYAEDIKRMASNIGLKRDFMDGDSHHVSSLVIDKHSYARRGLSRLTVYKGSTGFEQTLASFNEQNEPCLQVDLAMGNPAIEGLIDQVRTAGFIFSGWIPHFVGDDVLRMQKLQRDDTEWHPNLVNDTAQSLLTQMRQEITV